ncbi:hypothetical protein WMY93_023187 [Mugilogobius chulae]|uniref:Uncharacterized protein n=1 Tax=Mugilogobius chulae TaxID=88201 RepID=A0AAW0N3M8_9GOBI
MVVSEGLVRRLWRSRLIPDREEDNGKGDNDELCGTNPEKIPKTEFRAMTPSGSPVWPAGDRGAPGVTADQDGGALGSQGQDSDSRTVTCCLFKDRDHSELPGDPARASSPAGALMKRSKRCHALCWSRSSKPRLTAS